MSKWSRTLKTTRVKLGQSQSEMADTLGLSGKHYVCMLESGKYTFSDSTKKNLEYINALYELSDGGYFELKEHWYTT